MSFVLNSTKAILIGHRFMGEPFASRVAHSSACMHCVTMRATLARLRCQCVRIDRAVSFVRQVAVALGVH